MRVSGWSFERPGARRSGWAPANSEDGTARQSVDGRDRGRSGIRAGSAPTGGRERPIRPVPPASQRWMRQSLPTRLIRPRRRRHGTVDSSVAGGPRSSRAGTGCARRPAKDASVFHEDPERVATREATVAGTTNGPQTGGHSFTLNRRRPTLPGPFGPSTIGAEGLNCSVRKGKRCFPLAIATGSSREPSGGPSKLHRQPH